MVYCNVRVASTDGECRAPAASRALNLTGDLRKLAALAFIESLASELGR